MWGIAVYTVVARGTVFNRKFDPIWQALIWFFVCAWCGARIGIHSDCFTYSSVQSLLCTVSIHSKWIRYEMGLWIHQKNMIYTDIVQFFPLKEPEKSIHPSIIFDTGLVSLSRLSHCVLWLLSRSYVYLCSSCVSEVYPRCGSGLSSSSSLRVAVSSASWSWLSKSSVCNWLKLLWSTDWFFGHNFFEHQ